MEEWNQSMNQPDTPNAEKYDHGEMTLSPSNKKCANANNISESFIVRKTSSNFETPKFDHKISTLSPTTVATRMSETAVAFRLIQSEDNFNLNARSLEAEFIESPLVKIHVSNGRKAKNPWLFGVSRIAPSSFLISKFINWLIDEKAENITG